MPFGSIADFRDIESLNHYAVAVARGEDPEHVLAALRAMGRDNARTPMQWDASPHAGFTTGTPWIAVNPDHPEVNAAAQVDDPGSVFSHYRRLISLRHTEPAVAHGDFTMLLPDDDAVYAFTRRTPTPGRGRAAGAGQLHRREGGRRDRRMGRRRSSCWATTRTPPGGTRTARARRTTASARAAAVGGARPPADGASATRAAVG